jgi:uncharacterized membrane protein
MKKILMILLMVLTMVGISSCSGNSTEERDLLNKVRNTTTGLVSVGWNPADTVENLVAAVFVDITGKTHANMLRTVKWRVSSSTMKPRYEIEAYFGKNTNTFNPSYATYEYTIRFFDVTYENGVANIGNIYNARLNYSVKNKDGGTTMYNISIGEIARKLGFEEL